MGWHFIFVTHFLTVLQLVTLVIRATQVIGMPPFTVSLALKRQAVWQRGALHFAFMSTQLNKKLVVPD